MYMRRERCIDRCRCIHTMHNITRAEGGPLDLGDCKDTDKFKTNNWEASIRKEKRPC